MPPRKQENPSGARGAPEPALPRPHGEARKPLSKREQQRFERFQKNARKVGLLVSRDAYELYFRDLAE